MNLEFEKHFTMLSLVFPEQRPRETESSLTKSCTNYKKAIFLAQLSELIVQLVKSYLSVS